MTCVKKELDDEISLLAINSKPLQPYSNFILNIVLKNKNNRKLDLKRLIPDLLEELIIFGWLDEKFATVKTKEEFSHLLHWIIWNKAYSQTTVI